jgi:predicted phosphodiesterase
VTNLTWLHLSDLHWRESDEYNARIVVDQLLDYLAHGAGIAGGLDRIDLVFITGDIAYSGRPGEYALAGRFLDDLLQTTGVPRERLFLVPGNHDVDRDAISTLSAGATAILDSRDAANQFLANDGDRALVMQRFHNYQAFVNSYFGASHPPFDPQHYFYTSQIDSGGKRVAILGLNSAWLAGSDDDRSRLILGELQVRTALEQAEEADLRIALLHHPLEWLMDFDRDACEPLLRQKCDFVLLGHRHRESFEQQRGPGAATVVIAVDARYDTRSHPNACNLVRIDERGEGAIYLRRYSDRQGGFWTKDAQAYAEAPDGEYNFTLPVSGWRGARKPPTSAPEPTPGPGPVVPPTPPAPVPPPDRRPSPLDRWWQAHGYTGDPFRALNAEDADAAQLRDWHVNCLSLAGKRAREVDALQMVIREGDSRLGILYAPPGGGKTFYCRLAAQQCREGEVARGVVEIGVTELQEAQVVGPAGFDTRRLAQCILDQVRACASLPPAPAAEGSAGNVGHILVQCHAVASSLRPERGTAARLYIFIDDLGTIYYELKPAQREAALQALVDFLHSVAIGSCGEFVAVRVFLPLELYGPIQQELEPHWRERAWQERLVWTPEGCEEVVERRLEAACTDETRPGERHLPYLLDQNAIDIFRRRLKEVKPASLSPRRVIEALFAVVSYAVGQKIVDLPIPGEVYRRALE